MKNKGYAKFLGANRVHYGKFASGVFLMKNLGGKTKSTMVFLKKGY